MKTLLAFCLWLLVASVCNGQTEFTTYLNESFEEVPESEAAYFRVIQVADSSTGRGVLKDYYINGLLYQEINYTKLDSIRGGLTTTWYQNGQLKYRANYIDNQLEGKAELWYEDGQLQMVRNYNNGNLQGDTKSYHPNAQLKRHDVYSGDELVEGHCFNESGEEVAYYPLEVMPQFPGGQEAMFKFLYGKLNPVFTFRQLKEGSEAIISFVVGQDGKVDHVQVVRTNDEHLAKKGVKAVQAMPIWIPGSQDGKNVSVKYTVPVRVKMN